MMEPAGRVGCGALLLSAWLAVSAAGAELAELMPAETLVYVGWPGIGTLAETCRNTSLTKLLAEPEVVRARRELGLLVRNIIRGSIGEAHRETYDTAADVLDVLWRYPTAVGLVGMGIEPEGPRVDAAILVRANEDAEVLAEQVEGLLTRAGLSLANVTDVTIGGAALKEWAPLGRAMPLRWGVIDQDFMLTIGPKVCEGLGAGAKRPGLADSPRFAAAMKVVRGSATTPMVFIDLAGIIKTLESLGQRMQSAGLEVPFLGEKGGVQGLLDGLGFGSVESFSVVMSPRANGFETIAFLRAPGLGDGLSAILAPKPLTYRDLQVVPKDASWVRVMSVDLVQLYRGLLDALRVVWPDGHARVLAAVQSLETDLGVKILDDFLAAFEDGWAIFDAPSHGGWFVTGITLVAEVRPGNRLDEVTGKIVVKLAEALGGQKNLTLREERYRDQKITFASARGSAMPIAPAWSQYNGRWIFALYPQIVRATLDRMIDRGSSIIENPDFQRARSLMPGNAHSISYVDTAAGVRQMYALVLPIAQTWISSAGTDGAAIDVSVLPAANTLTRHLFGHASATAKTPDGWIAVSHGPLPIAVPTLGQGGVMLPLAAGIALPAVLAKAQTQAQLEASSADLRQIGVAVRRYADTHDGRFPPSLAALVEAGLLSETALTSPRERGGPAGDDRLARLMDLGYVSGAAAASSPAGPAPSSYVYIGGQSVKADPNNVLAFEKPGLYDRENTLVLFADSRIEVMAIPEFTRALEETNRRLSLERESTLPPAPPREPPPTPERGPIAATAPAPDREPTRPGHAISAADPHAAALEHVRALAAALTSYADAHQGQYPPNLEALIRTGLLEAGALVLPTDASGADNSYFYIPGQTRHSGKANVLAYPNPEVFGGEGTTVLFADGRIERLSTTELQTALKGLDERIARERELSRRAAGSRNLQMLGAVLASYADGHDGRFPPDLEALVRAGLADEKLLVSPSEKPGNKNSYRYLKGQTRSSEARNVLAYEDPANYDGQGTVALFVGGHVEFLPVIGLNTALEQTRARLGTRPSPEGQEQP